MDRALNWSANFPHEEKEQQDLTPIVKETIAFVKLKLQSNDASHDFSHIERVWRLARRIAQEEDIEDMEAVDLAALLHDIDDWKYSGNATAGIDAAAEFLNSKGMEQCRIDFITKIVKGVGFKEELGGNKADMFPELACVQDADRLEAIGALGIARCFIYGGHKKNKMYDQSIPPIVNLNKETYMGAKENTILNHFYEKLLKLKDLMKTESGKKIARERHAFMESFLEQIFAEINGVA